MTEDNKIFNILGFELELIPIESFKKFYEDNKKFLSAFSEKAFLKSIKIPPQYFLEQPENTREDLLNNKKDLIPNSKIAGMYIAVLKKDSYIFNCVRIDLNEAEDLFERISLQEKYVKRLIPIHDFTKEGFSSNFISTDTLEEGKYSLGLFLDSPLLLNKFPKANLGYFYCPKKGEDSYKNIYVKEIKVDFNDYQSLDLILDDIFNKEIKDIEEHKIIEKQKDKHLLRELDDILTNLVKEKAIPKGFIKKISKYVFKNNIQLLNNLSLIELISSYEQNFYDKGNYKQVNKIRNIINYLEIILKDNKNGN